MLRTKQILRRICAAVVLALTPLPAVAQDCRPEDISAVIDATGARLRELNTLAEPRIRGRLRELALKNGWTDGDLETKGRDAIDDATTRSFDSRAADLLADLDRLVEDERPGLSVCDRLQQARAKSKELVGLTANRADYAIARLEASLRPPPPQGSAPQAPASTPTAAVKPPPVAAPRPKSPPAGAWDSQTVREAPPALAPPPPTQVLSPPPPDPGSLGYTPEEIRAAGRGFFGTVSAGLASVIDYAFQSYGKPTGYVLGDEGGAAFFAGLRYGEGRLVTKLGGDRKVYWQGPSAGFDFGLAGSRVMFLVYSIEDHPELFQRFTGVDGSAYLVGGVGITLLKRGKIILAPIRTGLGLRVGANVGYLKFTPAPSLNPF